MDGWNAPRQGQERSGHAPRTGRPPDRAQLVGLLNAYLGAVVARRHDAIEVSPGYRETQNAVALRPGEGIWATAIALGPGARYADPCTGEAGFYGLVDEDGGTAVAGLRIKVVQEAVSEAEWILAREGMTFFNPAGFVTRLPREEVPADDAAAERRIAIAAVHSYFAGIAASDGSRVKAHPDCYRIENGTQTVGTMPDQSRRRPDSPAGDGVSGPLAPGVSNCVSRFENLRNITRDVIDRRLFYDEQAGAVWAHGIFERAPGARAADGEALRWLNFFEVFLIDGNEIRGIYAAMNYLPEEITSSGWPAVPERA